MRIAYHLIMQRSRSSNVDREHALLYHDQLGLVTHIDVPSIDTGVASDIPRALVSAGRPNASKLGHIRQVEPPTVPAPLPRPSVQEDRSSPARHHPVRSRPARSGSIRPGTTRTDTGRHGTTRDDTDRHSPGRADTCHGLMRFDTG